MSDPTLAAFSERALTPLVLAAGDTAVPFFNHSGLPLPILGEIWQISDPDNSGFLTPERFGAACRLIGHAQAEGGSAEVKPNWLATRKSAALRNGRRPAPRVGTPSGANWAHAVGAASGQPQQEIGPVY